MNRPEHEAYAIRWLYRIAYILILSAALAAYQLRNLF
jgi:hypothetical protein